jgi:hypothetical protein
MDHLILIPQKAIRLNVPRDYARGSVEDAVSIGEETCGEGISVRWNESMIQFSASNGTVRYKRAAIAGFRVDEDRRVMRWSLCELGIDLGDAILPVLYCEAHEKPEFEASLRILRGGGAPIDAARPGGALGSGR